METAPIIAIRIVGPRTRKPQKMKAWIRPGPEPLQQLALSEHDRRLVADAPRGVAGPRQRRGPAHERDQETAPGGRTAFALTASAAASATAEIGDAYAPLTFLISAEIAGTTSCRSPMTA